MPSETIPDDYFTYDKWVDNEIDAPFEQVYDFDDGDMEEATFMAQKGVFIFPPNLEDAE